MIRASGRTTDGRPLIVAGLSAENIKRLQEGQPINARYPDGTSVLIMYGNTEADIVEDMRSLGWSIPNRYPPPQ